MASASGKRVAIFGGGDYARVARVYLDRDSPHEVIAFTVDDEYATASELEGLPVLPWSEFRDRHAPGEDVAMLVAIGYSRTNEARRAVFEARRDEGWELISYVCSRATVLGDLEVGPNTFVFEDNVIQPYVRIGANCVLWSGNHIGHDTTINDHVFIASHAVVSGNVTIGERCFVGVNATFRDGVTVAPRCVIGAAAVVMKDTEEGDVLAVRGTTPLGRRSWDLANF